jgi:hypothetical protein
LIFLLRPNQIGGIKLDGVTENYKLFKSVVAEIK